MQTYIEWNGSPDELKDVYQIVCDQSNACNDSNRVLDAGPSKFQILPHLFSTNNQHTLYNFVTNHEYRPKLLSNIET